MNQLLFAAILLLMGLSACQPDETNEPIAWLCPNLNNDMYVYYQGGDSAKCWMPNMLSANGDNSNDLYEIGTYNISQLNYTIKLGNTTIYQTDSSFAVWDGNVNGQQAQQGVYDCTVNGTDIWGNNFTLNGQVSLMNNIDMVGSPTAYINCDTCQFPSMWNESENKYDPGAATHEFWANVVCE